MPPFIIDVRLLKCPGLYEWVFLDYRMRIALTGQYRLNILYGHLQHVYDRLLCCSANVGQYDKAFIVKHWRSRWWFFFKYSNFALERS